MIWGFLIAVFLPTALIVVYRFLPPPITPLMVIRLFEGQGLERDWVSWKDISPNLRRAAVAAEDNLFCEHSGFDWLSLEAAVKSYAEGKRAGGGSTISMQTAKNLFLWPRRSVVRKALEVPLTGAVELLWPKQRIMEVYLNIAEWGPGIYGAEAAARAYYGVSASKLSLRQASQLAAVLPSPLKWRASPPEDYVARRAATIRKRIGQLGPLLDCVSE
ncbi:monofunctional biosynthetic peptidoglycan transglycosylase [Pelagibius litoralis]|uniref:monofunctional biosynthetic peptidoglycan transglycosylase n=1 Tax=Pelagibius litoralis TaxID=374515 RepID=UPI001F0DADD7|nr:monofunctional biosynthetic peptidoglycan transglycosylase [Pelagibius litoralis]